MIAPITADIEPTTSATSSRIALRDYPLARLFCKFPSPEEKAQAAQVRDVLGKFLKNPKQFKLTRTCVTQ